jgi:hypothetical protein
MNSVISKKPYVRDEFLNCDYPTVGQMYDFANHPWMMGVSSELLEPMYQLFLRIREDFTWAPELKSKGERSGMKLRVREYMDLAVSPVASLARLRS